MIREREAIPYTPRRPFVEMKFRYIALRFAQDLEIDSFEETCVVECLPGQVDSRIVDGITL